MRAERHANPVRVLIIDDHAVVRRGLAEILVEEFPGLRTTEAATARSALECCSAGRWDLIILDLNLPDRSGLELLPELTRGCPGARILVLSAFPDVEYAGRILREGAAGYINKQNAADELVTATRKVLEGELYVSIAVAQKIAAELNQLPVSEPHQRLSRREFQVLRMIASGKSSNEIAAELGLSPKTVGTFRGRILQKLGLESSVDLTRYAIRHRLVD